MDRNKVQTVIDLRPALESERLSNEMARNSLRRATMALAEALGSCDFRTREQVLRILLDASYPNCTSCNNNQ